MENVCNKMSLPNATYFFTQEAYQQYSIAPSFLDSLILKENQLHPPKEHQKNEENPSTKDGEAPKSGELKGQVNTAAQAQPKQEDPTSATNAACKSEQIQNKVKESKTELKPQPASKKTGEHEKPKKLAPSRFSRLNTAEQRAYLDLFHKYSRHIPEHPKKNEVAQMKKFKELQTLVLEEQEEFQQYLEKAAHYAPEVYHQMVPDASRYMQEWLNMSRSRAMKYPQYYVAEESISLIPPKIIRETPNFLHRQTLLQLGTVPKAIIPRMHPKLHLPTDYSKIVKRYPTNERTKNEEKKPVCSDDDNAQRLALKYKANMVLSSSGLQCLLDNQNLERAWELPIVIRLHTVIENGQEMKMKVVYIDKPFPLKNMTEYEKNQQFYKLALKAYLLHPDHIKSMGFDSQPAETRQLSQELPEFTFDNDADITDLETFGSTALDTQKSLSKKQSLFKKELLHNLKGSFVKGGVQATASGTSALRTDVMEESTQAVHVEVPGSSQDSSTKHVKIDVSEGIQGSCKETQSRCLFKENKPQADTGSKTSGKLSQSDSVSEQLLCISPSGCADLKLEKDLQNEDKLDSNNRATDCSATANVASSPGRRRTRSCKLEDAQVSGNNVPTDMKKDIVRSDDPYKLDPETTAGRQQGQASNVMDAERSFSPKPSSELKSDDATQREEKDTQSDVSDKSKLKTTPSRKRGRTSSQVQEDGTTRPNESDTESDTPTRRRTRQSCKVAENLTRNPEPDLYSSNARKRDSTIHKSTDMTPLELVSKKTRLSVDVAEPAETDSDSEDEADKLIIDLQEQAVSQGEEMVSPSCRVTRARARLSPRAASLPNIAEKQVSDSSSPEGVKMRRKTGSKGGTDCADGSSDVSYSPSQKKNNLEMVKLLPKSDSPGGTQAEKACKKSPKTDNTSPKRPEAKNILPERRKSKDEELSPQSPEPEILSPESPKAEYVPRASPPAIHLDAPGSPCAFDHGHIMFSHAVKEIPLSSSHPAVAEVSHPGPQSNKTVVLEAKIEKPGASPDAKVAKKGRLPVKKDGERVGEFALDTILQAQTVMLQAGRSPPASTRLQSGPTALPSLPDSLSQWTPVENPSSYDCPACHNRTYNLWTLGNIPMIIRCSLHGNIRDRKQNLSYVSVSPKVEYQYRYGLEHVTSSEACKAWLHTYIRPNTSFVRARIGVSKSNILLLEHLWPDEVLNHGTAFNPATSMLVLHDILQHILSLKEGHYLLSHSQGNTHAHIKKNVDRKVGVYDLHSAHTTYADMEVPTNQVPWIPVNPMIILLHHKIAGRIPATFDPKDSRQQNETQNQGKKKKGKKKNKKKSNIK